MKNTITRPVALACFLGLALALIWMGLAHKPARESNPKDNKPITARERAAMLYSKSSTPLVAANVSVNHQTSGQRGALRPALTQIRSKQFLIAQASWRAHEGAKVNPAPVALPEGTTLMRGIPAHPSRVVVKMRTDISRNALANALDSVGASIATEPNASGWLTVDLTPPDPENEALGAENTLLTRMKALQGTGVLEAIEPDYLITHTAVPGDAGYNQGWLWGLQNAGQNGGTAGMDIGAAKAWDTSTGSTDVIVAIIDTGIRYTHQDLDGQMWTNPDEIPENGVDDDNDGYIDNLHGIDAVNNDGDPMDDNSHGTHCAGTIGAGANNGHAHVGVAWKVQLMACKFLSGNGWGYTSGAIECIDFAVDNGAKVLSNSWGGGGFSQGLYDSIARARDAGVIFVAAAGNSGEDTDSSPHYPSAYDLENIIAVAAIDRNGQLASWSNYGQSTVDLGAPGVDIFSSVADSDSSYAYYSGTSMAAPHVSGVAALLFADDDTLSVSQLKAQILNTSILLDDLRNRTVSGGLVNAANALDGDDDSELEIVLTVFDNPLHGGRKAAVMAQVSDVTPVIGATVTGDLDGTSLSFADDGNAPDTISDDGIYTAAMEVPDDAGVESVRISATAEASGKASASTSITVPVIHTPANDNFDERAGLSGRKVSLSGFTNRAATAEDNEPKHYWTKPQKSVWFTWVSPRNGRADIWLKGSSFDTVMAVYRGSTLDNLRRVARDDDGGGKLTSRVRFNVRKGRTYHIAIDGWSGAEGDINGRMVVKKRKPFKRSRSWWQ